MRYISLGSEAPSCPQRTQRVRKKISNGRESLGNKGRCVQRIFAPSPHSCACVGGIALQEGHQVRRRGAARTRPAPFKSALEIAQCQRRGTDGVLVRFAGPMDTVKKGGELFIEVFFDCSCAAASSSRRAARAILDLCSSTRGLLPLDPNCVPQHLSSTRRMGASFKRAWCLFRKFNYLLFPSIGFQMNVLFVQREANK